MRLQASEREVQHSILELLRLEGILALRLNSGAVKLEGRFVRFHSGGTGVADIIAFFPVNCRGEKCFRRYIEPLWIEVKAARGKQTPQQKNFEEHVTGLGMYYLVVRDLSELTAWLREHR